MRSYIASFFGNKKAPSESTKKQDEGDKLEEEDDQMENFVGNQVQKMLLEESKNSTPRQETESPAVLASAQSDADSEEFFDAVDELF